MLQTNIIKHNLFEKLTSIERNDNIIQKFYDTLNEEHYEFLSFLENIDGIKYKKLNNNNLLEKKQNIKNYIKYNKTKCNRILTEKLKDGPIIKIGYITNNEKERKKIKKESISINLNINKNPQKNPQKKLFVFREIETNKDKIKEFCDFFTNKKQNILKLGFLNKFIKQKNLDENSLKILKFGFEEPRVCKNCKNFFTLKNSLGCRDCYWVQHKKNIKIDHILIKGVGIHIPLMCFLCLDLDFPDVSIIKYILKFFEYDKTNIIGSKQLDYNETKIYIEFQ